MSKNNMSDKSVARDGNSFQPKLSYKQAERFSYFCEDLGFYIVMAIFMVGLAIRLSYI
jgi:hypothetical protein